MIADKNSIHTEASFLLFFSKITPVQSDFVEQTLLTLSRTALSKHESRNSEGQDASLVMKTDTDGA